MFTFEQLQIAGLQPSLLVNKIGLEADTLKRVFAKIRVLENGCWEWMASKRQGYGAINVKEYRKSIYDAHRLCYELVHGEQPRKNHIHHQVENGCIGPACCNPAHLESLSQKQHITEKTPTSATYINLHKTHCVNGHEFTVQNTGVNKHGRHCKQCDAERKQAARDAKLATTGRRKYDRDPAKMQTHCLRGHELSGANIRTITHKNGREYRRCIQCETINLQASFARRSGVGEKTTNPTDGGVGG